MKTVSPSVRKRAAKANPALPCLALPCPPLPPAPRTRLSPGTLQAKVVEAIGQRGGFLAGGLALELHDHAAEERCAALGAHVQRPAVEDLVAVRLDVHLQAGRRAGAGQRLVRVELELHVLLVAVPQPPEQAAHGARGPADRVPELAGLDRQPLRLGKHAAGHGTCERGLRHAKESTGSGDDKYTRFQCQKEERKGIEAKERCEGAGEGYGMQLDSVVRPAGYGGSEGKQERRHDKKERTRA